MSHVLILDVAILPKIYRPTDHWKRQLGNVPSDSVHLPSGQKAPDLQGYTHLIITGSEASILTPEPWYDEAARIINRALELGLSMLGSCFGHQLLVRTLSGKRHLAAAAPPEIGWLAIEQITADKLLDGLPIPWHCFAYHFDMVVDLPSPWRVLARSADCTTQVIRFGDKPIWGFQAHPEIDPDEAIALMRGLAEGVPVKAHLIELALDTEPHDDGVAREIVRRFLDGSSS